MQEGPYSTDKQNVANEQVIDLAKEKMRAAIKYRFIQPYVQLLEECLESLEKANKIDILQQLIQLVTNQRKTYQDRITLSICEDKKEMDQILYLQVQDILKNSGCDKESEQYIYSTLYTMLHEFRFNKSPDSKEIDEINASVAGAQRLSVEERWELSQKKIGTLSKRICLDSIEFTSTEIEHHVLTLIDEVLIEKLIELQEDETRTAIAENEKKTVEQLLKEDEMLARKLAKEEIEQEKKAEDCDSRKRKRETVCVVEKEEKNTESDEKLAWRLALEESKTTNRYVKPRSAKPTEVDCSNDEALAKLLQESEKDTYLPSYTTTTTSSSNRDDDEEGTLINRRRERKKEIGSQERCIIS